MRQKSILWSLLIFVIIGLLTTLCKKDDNTSDNPYNGKTTAVFNPNLKYGILTDQDGNIYKTIVIGTQTWMAENLRTTTLNNSTKIKNKPDETDWKASVSEVAYCSYNNTKNVDSISTFGFLYNWAAVKSGKLAPIGWHVPTNDEWHTLLSSMGDIRNEQKLRIEGGKLKEIGTTHWLTPNNFADNSYGFTALPGGGRYYSAHPFSGIQKSGCWWSSTGGTANDDAWVIYVDYKYGGVSFDAANLGNGERGHSIRCIKDN